jgi:hypothetical protein
MADTTLVEPKNALRRRFAPFGVGLAGSGAMTTLIDGLVPNQLWALVNRQTIAIGVLRRRPDTSPQSRT